MFDFFKISPPPVIDSPYARNFAFKTTSKMKRNRKETQRKKKRRQERKKRKNSIPVAVCFFLIKIVNAYLEFAAIAPDF